MPDFVVFCDDCQTAAPIHHTVGLRLTLLRVVTVLGVALFAITETLGLLGCIGRASVVVCWVVLGVCGVAFAARHLGGIRQADRGVGRRPGGVGPTFGFALRFVR